MSSSPALLVSPASEVPPVELALLNTSWIMVSSFSQRVARGTTASAPASPPARRLLPDAPKIVGCVKIPPSLYHSMPKCGTLGGDSEKLPLMLICGSFRCGRLHEKLKALFIALIAELTAFLAAFILSEIAECMLLKIDDTVLRAEFRAELIVDFMVLNTLDTVLRAEFTLLLIVLVIVFQILEVTELIAFHAVLATFWIALVTELTTARAASILLLIAPFMLSQIVEAVVLIALQIVLATLLIAVVTAVNVAFAASILLLIQPPIASSAPDTVDFMLSQIGRMKSLQFCQIN